MRKLFKLLVAITVVIGTMAPSMGLLSQKTAMAASPYEQRAFSVEGKGDADQIAKMQYRYPFSPYEPTGLYLEPNETAQINVSGNQGLYYYVGTYSYGDESPRQQLHPGNNTISDPEGGMLYFSNTNPSGFINVQVTSGGSPVPFFELGKHTEADWKAMMDLYPNSHAVELKSQSALITVSYESAKKYLYDVDPTPLLQAHDRAIQIQNEMTGVSGSTGVDQLDRHYIHYVEDAQSNYPGYATSYRTAYAPYAMPNILDVETFIRDGWVAFHEQGHLRQQNPWKWNGVSEVTNNILTLEVQTKFGNQSALETEGTYEEVFAYFDNPNKNFNDLPNGSLVKLAMFWQLRLVYGDNFYPELHQAYRALPADQLPVGNNDKSQFFMLMASKVANQNLIPFFEMWGLYPSDQTRQTIYTLNLPLLTSPIWNSTDSNIIQPNTTGPVSNDDKVVFQGAGEWDAATITFPLSTQKIKAESSNPAGINDPWFPGLFYSFTLFDGTTGIEKQTASSNGPSTPANFINTLNNTPYNYGDVVKLHHSNAPNYDVLDVYIDGQLINSREPDQFYKITTDGLEALPVTIDQDKIVFQGASEWDAATITFQPDTQTIKAETANPAGINNASFSGEYYSFTLYDGTGEEKKKASSNGTDTPVAFINTLNNTPYNYGDIVKLHHIQAPNFDVMDIYIDGVLTNSKKPDQYYKITQSGLEEISNPYSLDKVVFQGAGEWDAATLTFNPQTRTIAATSSNMSQVNNPWVTGLFYSFSLYDGATGTLKQTASSNGESTPAAFVNTLNNTQYKFGDIVQFHHAHGPAYNILDVTIDDKLTSPRELDSYYKLTTNGLEPTLEVPPL